MLTKIVDRAELSPFISPQHNKSVPIHNWYTFKHGYSKDLVSNFITYFNLPRNSWVLDPFCGSGTTLLTCKELESKKAKHRRYRLKEKVVYGGIETADDFGERWLYEER